MLFLLMLIQEMAGFWNCQRTVSLLCQVLPLLFVEKTLIESRILWQKNKADISIIAKQREAHPRGSRLPSSSDVSLNEETKLNVSNANFLAPEDMLFQQDQKAGLEPLKRV